MYAVLFHTVFIPTSFASLFPGAMLRMHRSFSMNLPLTLKEFTEKVRRVRVN